MGQALPFCVKCENKRGCDSCAELHEWIVEHMEPRWISVKERLPEKGGEYFVLYGDRKPGVRQFLNGTFRLNYESAESYRTLTHWMPVPELPKEER